MLKGPEENERGREEVVGGNERANRVGCISLGGGGGVGRSRSNP